MTEEPTELDGKELRQKLNLETARLGWPELQRHFARGVVIVVSPSLDLREVAAKLAEDDTAGFGDWTGQGLVTRAADHDARRWQASNSSFWCVVVAPWVLVQEIPGREGQPE